MKQIGYSKETKGDLKLLEQMWLIMQASSFKKKNGLVTFAQLRKFINALSQLDDDTKLEIKSIFGAFKPLRINKLLFDKQNTPD